MYPVLKKFIAKVFFLFFLISPLLVQSQNKKPVCTDWHNGIFYYYPKNSTDRFTIYNDGGFQKEINTATGDTSLWKLEWTSDCSFTEKYISGSAKLNAETSELLKKHKLAYEITSVTDSFFTFKGYIDKPSTIPIQVDTMWLNEKIVIAGNELFKQIINPSVLRKNHFSDTSKYAVLYVYRPGKFSNSMGNFLVYFDDNIMCVAKNSSGYIFKILKEGQFEIKSKLYKDHSAVKMDIKFGNVYYAKAMIHWTISSRLYNFKLEMANIKPEQGKMEFDEVILNK
jgi:hypothetical protein